MESLWEQTSGHTGFCHLEQDAKTDVLIIGGGIAGVLCAYLLHQAGVLYLLLEAETIGGGITKNTTAKITSQHGLIYDKLIRKFGAGQAKQYLDANEAALQKYRELCRGMDCDFEEKTAYVYSLNDRRKIERELDALEKERENLMVEANDRDYKRQTTLKNNEQRQTEIRRELNKLTAEHDSLMGNPATTEALAANEQRQSNFRRELDNLAGEREKLLSDEGSSRDYERLASIKSREIQLQDELNKLEAQSAPPLTVEHLARVIELWTKIPASQIQEAEYERLAKLEDRLKEHLIGQDEAVHAVAAAVRRGRVGIASKRKPVSFIFVGSTGVGKTELVKRLAQDMFNSPESLIRLDMSEFMEKFAVSRIIGSPPGYVGYDEAGQLTEKVRRKPYCVILFDEIEKAHPDVLNIMLQILDDGHITDAQGRVVNFENTVIVMTSNAGSDKGMGSLGFGRTANEQGKDKAMKALEGFLRPEFINRVDEVVYFNRLTEGNFKSIARIMLGELTDNLREKGISFSWDESVLEHLVKTSYSVAYGARNLRRQVQKDLEDPIATKIIESYMSPITQLKASANDSKIELLAL